MLNILVVNFKHMVKDEKVLIIILTAPVFILFILGLLIPGEETVMNIKIGIVDYANSAESKYIIEQLTKDASYKVTIMGEEELYSLLEEQFISIGLIIPQNSNEKSIRILKTDNFSDQVIQNKVNNILKELTLLKRVPSVNQNDQIPINYIDRYRSTKLNLILGFFINYMMYSMIYITNEFTELKRQRILKRCYTMPYSSFSLLGGIMLSFFLLLGLQMIILNIFSYLFYQEFLIANLWGGIALFAPFILVILGIGIIISKTIKNPDLTAVIANLIIVPTGTISGTFLPKQMIPSFLERFAFLSPQFWVANGIEKLNQGQVLDILPNTMVLILLACCLLAVSSYNFKGMLQI